VDLYLFRGEEEITRKVFGHAPEKSSVRVKRKSGNPEILTYSQYMDTNLQITHSDLVDEISNLPRQQAAVVLIDEYGITSINEDNYVCATEEKPMGWQICALLKDLHLEIREVLRIREGQSDE
jgi:hypothetical protein